MSAKVTTQALFEETYLENKDLFDEMSHDELVSETVSQLTSQGVNIQNLLHSKDDFTVDVDGCFHYHVLSELETFYSCPNQTNASKLTERLQSSLATRVFAASSGCLERLTRLINSGVEVAAKPLVVLLEKQPDIADDGFMDFLIRTVQNESLEIPCRVNIVRCITNVCTLHEDNRQKMVAKKCPEVILGVMESNVSFLNASLIALRAFLLDDDIRVPFGKAHEHAQHIVGDCDAIPRVIEAFKSCNRDLSSCVAVLTTLGKFCVRNEYCQQLVDCGGLQLALELFRQEDCQTSEAFICALLAFVKSAGGNDDVKDKMTESGILEMIVQILNDFGNSRKITEIALLALSVVVLRRPNNSEKVIANGGVDAVINALDAHGDIPSVGKSSCLAIKTLTNRNENARNLFMAKGVEDYLLQLCQIEECREGANDTLRALNSTKGTLNEPWKGTGHHLAQD